MKNILVYVGALSVSMASIAATLLPAGHTTCLNIFNDKIIAQACGQGTELYFDELHRCGCLHKEDIVPIETCATKLEKEMFGCNEEANERFSVMFRQTTGEHRIELAGCGCFSTDEGAHGMSMP